MVKGRKLADAALSLLFVSTWALPFIYFLRTERLSVLLYVCRL
jgi:hypothetical protein